MQHTAWVPTGLLARDTAPPDPQVGQIYFDTTLGRVRSWDGVAWIAGGRDEVHVGVEAPEDDGYTLWIKLAPEHNRAAPAPDAWRDATAWLGEGWAPLGAHGRAVVRRLDDVVHCRFRVSGAAASQPDFFVPPVGLRPDHHSRGVALGVSLDGGVIASTLTEGRVRRVTDHFADVEAAFCYTTADPVVV